MSIDNLTIGDIKQIAALLAPAPPQQAVHPFVGKYVICRCASAGVHAGVLVSQAGDQAILKDSRRLWQWTANAGIALSGVAQHGLKGGKVDTLNPEIALTGVIETIPCSVKAEETIRGA